MEAAHEVKVQRAVRGDGPMTHGGARGEGSGSRSAFRGPCLVETILERAHEVEAQRMLHGESHMSHGDARGDSSWSKSAAYGSWRRPMSRGPMSHGDARAEGSGSRSAAYGACRGPCLMETLVERAHGVEVRRTSFMERA